MAALLWSCAGESPEPASLRLVDRVAEASVASRPTTQDEVRPTEWTFSGADTAGWQAAAGVDGLRVEDGALVGRTTDAQPILRVAWQPTIDPEEPVHAIEVRMAASRPGTLRAELMGAETFALDPARDLLRSFSRGFEVPLLPGEEAQTYTLESSWGVTAGAIRQLVLLPTDTPGSDFRIESVRVIFRREHLAEIPSGVGWQGLGEIYRETLVTRSPESWHFSVELPDQPLLDLAVGTVEEDPVTFRIDVMADGEPLPVFERTLARPQAWSPVRVDLGRWAGRTVDLRLTVRAEREGALGFWGSPAVRRRVRTSSGERPPQGVILVVADTLRRDHLSSYGYERDTSPVLARLAAEGALFEDALAQATWTKVSMPSILTSLYPSSHGVRDFPDRLPAAAETLAEAYREAGYATLALASIPFVGRVTNLHQGFETVHESGSLPRKLESKTARELVDRLLPWLDAHRDMPFFVLLHVSDPHDPFEPYAPYDALWSDPAFDDEFARQHAAARERITDPLLRRFGMPTREELLTAGVDPGPYVAHEVGWYDGSIRAMDAELGRLVDHLESLGLDERVLLAFTSDHGEEFLEHGRHFHGQSVYAELAEVPLILHGPGVTTGTVVEETVQTLDLMPTLLELSGLRTPERAQGRSLVPLLSSAGGRGRVPPAIVERLATSHAGAPPPLEAAATAVIADGWKLIHHTTPPPGVPEIQLFDRARDPGDLHDVADRHPQTVERLLELLASWRKSAEASRLPRGEQDTEGLSQQELERLRSLGYI